jgi:hypothetical protein
LNSRRVLTVRSGMGQMLAVGHARDPVIGHAVPAASSR